MVKNLRILRTSRGVSQQQLADVIGTSQQSINKYENHSVEPDIRALTKLADFFDTTIDYLVGRAPPAGGQLPAQPPELTGAELQLLRDYRRLTKAEQESIQLVIKNYLKK